ncbi:MULTISPECIES: glycoside hydrolase family 38 C-terminal domain-containing protein [Actinosynnema]|uniref:alpha-mannosidase n=1 Tax=Actinosynnema TaxID=40566 RepID=UPI0020A3D5C5|nr:glycoside hydrolase family 38 C-terminal domain-containing protein [Actinosynnema pretiosum]MCP2094857.1 alpha-mannosidase [Actinosynnema pretiosum]
MHDDRLLVERRLARVLDERIRPAVHDERRPLAVERWHAGSAPVPVAAALAADYEPTATGEPWGPPWATTWFRLTGEVPAEWAGRAVEALVDLGFTDRMPGFQCEGLAHTADGAPIKGVNPRNAWVPVGDPVDGGEHVHLLIEAAANPVILFGGVTDLGHPDTAGDRPLYRLGRVELAVRDATTAELVHDLEVLGQLMAELDTRDPRRWEVLRAVERALDRVDLGDVTGTAGAARAELADVLASPANASAHRVVAVGHAHIDSAWLWPLRETVRKVTRTTANVTALMDSHPELVFAMSQAQQLAWLKEHSPEVYRRVREHAAAGRFVPVGGMWVESDTNLPGGEALARQLVHGKRFFLDEFGVECAEVWLPDSFGYSAALPQLVRLAGAKWFLTQKISWNQTNRFPHHTFDWEGIDGTRVFTHFPPVDTYNAELTGAELARASANFAEKGRARLSLVPFGHGDGGGGPTREMLARAARTADLEGSPRVRIAAPAEFFAEARAEYPEPPVWVGELYLELHRGTYTSQARTKQGNRRGEHLLREAELWAAAAAVAGLAEYPHERFDRMWKVLLLHQFHDVLPGSSIAWVHREAERALGELAEELRELVADRQRVLAGGGEGEVVFNAAPHAVAGVPALGAGPVEEGRDECAASTVDGSVVLDNGVLRVVVDARGLVVSVLDLAAGREAVPEGMAANLLQLHPDLPNDWDAWDVDPFYRNTSVDLVDGRVALEGGGVVRVEREFGSSRVVQRLRLAGALLEVDTEVDWHEREKLLKLAFPLDVHADRAAAEIQFGHVHRPVHTNTSWDAARFEVCAHRWVRVGEPGYGFAVVNDSTYGHDVTRGVGERGTWTSVRLSLLRAPRFPDPEADQGVHRMRCALVVGAGVADAVREGYRINLPPRRVPGSARVAPLVAVANPAVVVEAVKLADDRSGDVVVRLYESLGGRAATALTTSFPVTGAAVTDLLERPFEGDGREVDLAAIELRPFQVLTLRLARG